MGARLQRLWGAGPRWIGGSFGVISVSARCFLLVAALALGCAFLLLFLLSMIPVGYPGYFWLVSGGRRW